MQLSFHGGDILSRILKKVIQQRNTECIEEYLKYDKRVLDNSSNLYYIGYWQSYKYFSSIESELRKIFTFPNSIIDNYNKNLSDVILSSNSVSLHIRRGDYVGNSIYEILPHWIIIKEHWTIWIRMSKYEVISLFK